MLFWAYLQHHLFFLSWTWCYDFQHWDNNVVIIPVTLALHFLFSTKMVIKNTFDKWLRIKFFIETELLVVDNAGHHVIKQSVLFNKWLPNVNYYNWTWQLSQELSYVSSLHASLRIKQNIYLFLMAIPLKQTLRFVNKITVILEAVAQMCFVRKVFLEILQNWQENTCARVSFLIKLQASGKETLAQVFSCLRVFLLFTLS